MTEFWSASTQKLPVHYRQSIEVNVDLADDGGLGKALFFYPQQISSSIPRSDKDKYFSACLGLGDKHFKHHSATLDAFGYLVLVFCVSGTADLDIGNRG